MTPEEILLALQVGEISLEDAKKTLTSSDIRTSQASAFDTLKGEVQQSSHTQSSDHLPIGESPIIGVNLGAAAQGTIPMASERKGAIAIVGMSGKYPDAKNLSEYWENLVQAKNSVREIPLSRFDVSDYYDSNPRRSGKISCKWLGALDEIEDFDPLFFHLSPA